MKPKLQLALDIEDLNKAIKIAKQTEEHVDIIEIGTVLAIEAGLSSVREIREELPNSTLLADIRIIKAGGKLAEMAYNAGADIVTIISDSTSETFEAVTKAKENGEGRQVLIEINDKYNDEDLKKWKRYNLTHLIYHRGSEITATNEEWTENDLNEIKRLSDLGFKVYVTGGIGVKEISLFEGIPVECFIIGRTIAASSDPKQAAMEFQAEINKYF